MRSLPIDQLRPGDAAEARRTVSESDVYLFAGISGDFNPAHVDAEYARGTPFGARIAHGPLTLSLCSGLLGTELPGLGTVAVSNRIDYLRPVFIGDTITVRVAVAALEPERNRATIEVTWHNQSGELVASGEVIVKPPREAVVFGDAGG
jgi:3-hydroxybutyryl-CoA dehydratase